MSILRELPDNESTSREWCHQDNVEPSRLPPPQHQELPDDPISLYNDLRMDYLWDWDFPPPSLPDQSNYPLPDPGDPPQEAWERMYHEVEIQPPYWNPS
ncbi:MAG: hypothetical protein M1299_00715 [Firmicutes bacterium]|nr:hypothetical protein [Bacillota bacterium]MCL5038348.1 hypothetical protein [Bacillota bacterium]